MVSSYILNGKVFSKEYITNSKSFKEFLKNQAHSIEENQRIFL